MIICLGQFQFVQVHTLIKSTLLSLSKVWTNCMITPFELSIRTHFSHLTHQMKSSIWFLKTLFPGNSGVVQVVETLLLLQEVWIPSLVRELDPTGNPPPIPHHTPHQKTLFPSTQNKKSEIGPEILSSLWLYRKTIMKLPSQRAVWDWSQAWALDRVTFLTFTVAANQPWQWTRHEGLGWSVVFCVHGSIGVNHSSCVRLFVTPWTVAYCLWDSLGKNTGVGCHSLLQGIFLTQGSNLCLLRYRQIL